MQAREMLVASKNFKIKCPNVLVPDGWCVHNTYNDASANNEVQYMILNQNHVSFHVAVDDKEVVKGIPYDRNAWAAGDGNGPGNRKYLHLEICYSKSGGERYMKAEENAVQFLAKDLKQRGWGIDKVKKHQDFSGKNCPHRILNEGRWKSFLNRIEAAMKSLEPKKRTDRVIVPNTQYWQAKALVEEYQARDFHAYGDPVHGYLPGQYPQDSDGFRFIVETDFKSASLVLIELRNKGFDRTVWETI